MKSETSPDNGRNRPPSNTLCLRIDVDYYQGFVQGVPRLAEELNRAGAVATFFVVMGPDTLHRHLTHLTRHRYRKHLRSIGPLRLLRAFGLRAFLTGWAGTKRFIAADFSRELRNLRSEGHEIGIHGYDHYVWAETCNRMSIREARRHYRLAVRMFIQALGTAPRSSASPAWRCSENTLAAQDDFTFVYASDTRGKDPYYPIVRGRRAATLQLPVTAPCVYEVAGMNGTPGKTLRNHYVDRVFNRSVNVLTLHDWYEGMLLKNWTYDLVRAAQDKGLAVRRMIDAARPLTRAAKRVPSSPIEQVRTTTTARTITVQAD